MKIFIPPRINLFFSSKVFAAFFLFIPAFIQAGEKITIVYPDVKAPYNIIFDQITKGIYDEFDKDTDIEEIKLPENFNASDIAQKIKTKKVIALGKRGWIIAKEIYKTKPVVVGALPIKPNGISGVSLMTSPDMLFRSLKELAPKIKTITVLYTPASAWIINSAKQQAQAQGFILRSIEVSSLHDAVKKYDELFHQEQLEQHAIWLPLDPITANDKVIVPVILEKAWTSKMVVFSSKPTHAKRGALFSALPDNELLGKQLARMVNEISQTPQSIVKPLNNIQLAVNLRTAAHLGFDYGTSTKSGFALTFPN